MKLSFQVGLAIIDLKSPQVRLFQFLDHSSYTFTKTIVALYAPREILVPSTSTGSVLLSTLKTQFPTTGFVTVQRKYFNESKGSLHIKSLCLDGPAGNHLKV